jgi:hypothetical protein
LCASARLRTTAHELFRDKQTLGASEDVTLVDEWRQAQQEEEVLDKQDNDVMMMRESGTGSDGHVLHDCTSCGIEVAVQHLGLSCAVCDLFLHHGCMNRGLECDCPQT